MDVICLTQMTGRVSPPPKGGAEGVLDDVVETESRSAGEIAVGLLILSYGRAVKCDLAASIAFLILITPLGVWTLPNPLMAIGLARLLAKEFPPFPVAPADPAAIS
ncbi:MAG: hypothetical protein ACLGIS_12200 [Actinomycetes bacterium]